jgi:hypothetical protein
MDRESHIRYWLAEIFGELHEPPCAHAPDISDDEPFRWPWSAERQDQDE